MSQPCQGPGGSYDRQVPTSPRTSRRLRALGLLPLVLALTALSSCGDIAHTSAPSGEAAGAIGNALERRSGPASHLLADDAMPTAGAAWSSTATITDVSVLGPCHLTSLVDIGALTAVRRTWTSAKTTPRAVQVVAKFADGKSAWRAHQVLVSWRGDCATEDDLDVTALRPVPVPIGVGNAYRVGRGTRATDVGILRKGRWLSVVAVVAPSSAVPTHSALARAAVKRIAATYV